MTANSIGQLKCKKITGWKSVQAWKCLKCGLETQNPYFAKLHTAWHRKQSGDLVNE